MPVFEEFPYTNFHELNLDWILKEMKELDQNVKDLIASDIIKYADPIQWSILTAYDKYTIVLDSNYNAYMSVQDVPAGTALNDTAYWQQIGDLYGYLEDQGITQQVRAKKHFRFHVNGSTGSDDNNGMSAGTAFKTLEKLMSMSMKYTEIRCYIEAAGTYELPDVWNISGCSLHITATVPGVVIQLSTDGSNEFSFYNAHINLQGKSASEKLTLIAPPSAGIDYGNIYSDGCTFYMKWVEIPYNGFNMYGGSLNTVECDFNRIYGYNSYMELDTLGILNTDPVVTPLSFKNCKIYTHGIFTVSEPDMNTSTAYLELRLTDAMIANVILPTTTNKYLTGIDAQGSYINITAARQSAIAANSVNGNIVDAATNFNDVFNPA